MALRQERGVIGAAGVDLRRLHEAWLALAFPRRGGRDHPVMGRWEPRSTAGRVAFRAWGALGVLAVGIAYPAVLLGYAVRTHARRVDRLADVLGLLGAVALAALAWGALAALARTRFSATGFLAVGAAAAVATAAAGLAVVFARVGGRATTVLLAYPLGVTALFLPPAVAALYSPAVAAVVFPESTSLAVWLLDNVLSVGGVAATLRARFELAGVAYVGLWFGAAVPVGWLLGTLVTLAGAVRPD